MNDPSPSSGAPEGYDPSAFPPFAVTVDLTIFTIRDNRLHVLLVQRGADPHKGAWALPGGFVGAEEDLHTAAHRELREETGLELVDGHLEQLRTYGAPGRDPRMRVISVAYLVLAPDLPDPTPGTDADRARWWAVDDLALPGLVGGTDRVDADGHRVPLAFDHAGILADAVDRAAAKIEYTSLATAFCQRLFTLVELQRVYEAVWGTALDRRNFRRWVEQTVGLAVPVEGHMRKGAVGRPATLYRARDGVVELHPPMLRPTNARRLRRH